MPDKPFVINDRRKFTSDGEARHDADAATTIATLPPDAEPGRSEDEPDSARPHKEPIAFPASSPKSPASEPDRSADEPEENDRNSLRTHETIAFPSGAHVDSPEAEDAESEGNLPPLTAEQSEQAARAYNATVERLDTALRANNLGSEPLPQMSFERFVQSLYMQALMQLGGAAEPGQPPQVDILGARQTIDMLSLFAAKTKGNLSETEDKLMESALFELHMGFLEITQALARQAAGRHPGGAPGQGKGPGLIH